ncbi:putative ATP-dependent RNA helicase DDX43-like protein, partial [Dinothrombium tinctorium]
WNAGKQQSAVNDDWDDWDSAPTHTSAASNRSNNDWGTDWNTGNGGYHTQASNDNANWDWEPNSQSSNQRYDSAPKHDDNGRNWSISFGRGIRSNQSRGQNFDNRNDFSRRNNSDRSSFKVASSDVGKIIGRGGSTIKELESKSGARIKVIKSNDHFDNETTIELSGTEEQRNKAQSLISDITDGSSRSSKQFKPLENDGGFTASNTDFVDWEAAINESAEATKRKWASLPPVKKNFYFESPDVSAMHPDDVKKFRLENNNIMISHFNEEDRRPIPNPVQNFSQAFDHFPEILDEIAKQGFEKPSPIQCQSWPILLQGIDLIGIAQTGTGKTLAYLLPAMIHIDQQPMPRDQRPGPTALIMAPTRELAQQIEREAKKYSYRNIKTICIYGGGNRKEQIGQVGKGVEIVIATPGRLNDLCMNRYIDLTSVSYLVSNAIIVVIINFMTK